MNKLVIKSITQISTECPAQWSGYLIDGRPIYARYRHGTFTFKIGMHCDSDPNDPSEYEVYLKFPIESLPGERDGYLPYGTMVTRTKEFIDWPDLVVRDGLLPPDQRSPLLDRVIHEGE